VQCVWSDDVMTGSGSCSSTQTVFDFADWALQSGQSMAQRDDAAAILSHSCCHCNMMIRIRIPAATLFDAGMRQGSEFRIKMFFGFGGAGTYRGFTFGEALPIPAAAEEEEDGSAGRFMPDMDSGALTPVCFTQPHGTRLCDPVKKRHFCAIYISNASFHQDRLGTNIGKTQKKRVAFFVGRCGGRAAGVPACSRRRTLRRQRHDDRDRRVCEYAFCEPFLYYK
jgi:hypothetical protein